MKTATIETEMTPQTKAKELIEKFREINWFSEYDKKYESANARLCKRSAEILCDEILSTDEIFSSIAATYWWDEVKAEIEKL